MKLSERELARVNGTMMRMYQKYLEFPVFRRMGLNVSGRKVLEVGCGSGRGAALLAEDHPESYTGIDVMPEQISAARERRPGNCEFRVMDASDLEGFPDGSLDVVLICRSLHHIRRWRGCIRECHRVLDRDGHLFVSEPYRTFTRITERIFGFGHPEEALFGLGELEDHLKASGFQTERILFFPVFFIAGRRAVPACRAKEPGSGF